MILREKWTFYAQHAAKAANAAMAKVFCAIRRIMVVKVRGKKGHSIAPLQPYDHHKGYREGMGYILEEHFVTLLGCWR